MLLSTIGAYTLYGDSANFLLGVLSGGDPLVVLGQGSLRARPGTAATYRFHSTRNTAPYRFVSGLGYCSWRYQDTTTNSVDCRLGYAFCLSQADISGTTGTAYMFEMALQTTTGIIVRPRFTQVTTGLNQLPASPSYIVGTDMPYTLGQIYTCAVQWVFAATYGGIKADAWWQIGTALPNREAAPQLSWTYPLAVSPTSFGEGEFANQRKASGVPQVLFDQVGRYAVIG